MATPEETADQVAKLKLALEAAEAEHAAALEHGESTKSPEELVHDLFTEIVARLGNRPPMLALLKRLARALEQTAPAPAPENAQAESTQPPTS